MDIPKELRFTNTHEWVRQEDDLVTVGVTDFAQDQLGDLTYIELPDVEAEVDSESEIGILESVKAASDLYAPVAGVVKEINEAVVENTELVNNDPYGEGWLFKLEPGNPADVDQLLDADEYEQLVPARD